MYAITAVTTTDFEKIKSPEHEQDANERSTFYVDTKFVSDKWDREVGKAITSILEDMEDYTNEFFEDGEIEVFAYSGIYSEIDGILGKDKIMGKPKK